MVYTFSMRSTKAPQIKTLESMLIYILNKASPTSPAAQAFEKMLEHFIDEDFIYTQFHEEIIHLIYQKDFYKHHYAYALPQILNIDNKTLLEYRKRYLQLFAKYYLGVARNSKSLFLLLQSTLKKEQSLLDSQTV